MPKPLVNQRDREVRKMARAHLIFFLELSLFVGLIQENLENLT